MYFGFISLIDKDLGFGGRVKPFSRRKKTCPRTPPPPSPIAEMPQLSPLFSSFSTTFPFLLHANLLHTPLNTPLKGFVGPGSLLLDNTSLTIN